jgi:negative regulator of genetic competence, sporulation and motility
MEMKQISASRLQIDLTQEDLRTMDLTYDQIDQQQIKTRLFILSLLEAARRTTGFQPDSQVFIEVYPNETGGCTVFLSDLGFYKYNKWRVRRRAVSPVAYQFDDIDILIAGSVKLFRHYAHRIHKSMLYRVKENWVLVVYPLDIVESITLYFLDEYALRCGEGKLAAAWLDEHGRCILKENAIDLISAYFG